MGEFSMDLSNLITKPARVATNKNLADLGKECPTLVRAKYLESSEIRSCLASEGRPCG